MSWTSEFEPQPPRPGGYEDADQGDDHPVDTGPVDTEPQNSDSQDSDSQDSDSQNGGADESDEEIWTDRPALTTVPDDGPLDPSIFDGLFADLTLEAEAPSDDEVLPPDAVDLEHSANADHADSAAADHADSADADHADGPVGLEDELEGEDEAAIIPAPPVEPVPRNAATDPASSQVSPDPDPDPEGAMLDGQDVVQPVEAQHPLQQPQVVVTPEATPLAEIPPVEIQPVEAPAPDLPPVSHPPAITSTADIDPLPQTAPSIQQLQPKPPRRWRSFAVAIGIGAGLGIGGAVLLSQLVGRSDSNDDVAASSTTLQQSGSDPAANPDGEPQTDAGAETDASQQAASTSLGAAGRFELNALRFDPGTLSLTAASQANLNQVVAATAEHPESAVSIVVRTYSEPTAAENRDLSKSQAQAITDYLTGAGVDSETITAVGLGAPPLSAAQPVENFVVVGAGLRSSILKSAIDGLSPFAIGIDPVTSQLRPESIETLNYLGQAMTADQLTSISLAAYSYGQPDAVQNQTQAAVAAEAAAAFLVANYQLDPNRIALLTLGQAQYIVSSATGTHISVRWGDEGRRPVSVSEADQTAIAFEAGSVTISAGATQALDRLATAAAQSEASFVIDVHTATETSSSANSQLGERQAAAILEYSRQIGTGDDQLRLYSGGNRRQFGGGPASRVVITQVP